MGKVFVVGPFSPGQGRKPIKGRAILGGYMWNPAEAGRVFVRVGDMLAKRPGDQGRRDHPGARRRPWPTRRPTTSSPTTCFRSTKSGRQAHPNLGLLTDPPLHTESGGQALPRPGGSFRRLSGTRVDNHDGTPIAKAIHPRFRGDLASSTCQCASAADAGALTTYHSRSGAERCIASPARTEAARASRHQGHRRCLSGRSRHSAPTLISVRKRRGAVSAARARPKAWR